MEPRIYLSTKKSWNFQLRIHVMPHITTNQHSPFPNEISKHLLRLSAGFQQQTVPTKYQVWDIGTYSNSYDLRYVTWIFNISRVFISAYESGTYTQTFDRTNGNKKFNIPEFDARSRVARLKRERNGLRLVREF